LLFTCKITRKLVFVGFFLPSACWVPAWDCRRSEIRCHANTLRQPRQENRWNI